MNCGYYENSVEMEQCDQGLTHCEDCYAKCVKGFIGYDMSGLLNHIIKIRKKITNKQNDNVGMHKEGGDEQIDNQQGNVFANNDFFFQFHRRALF